MNPDYEKQLNAAVDRMLKSLPDVEAPPSLAPRVLRALQAPLAPAAARRSWQNWPASLRWPALAALAAFFAALCFGSWRLVQTEPVTLAWHQIEAWGAQVATFCNAFKAVLSAVFLAIRQLSPALLLGGCVAAALAYGCCLALGTVYFRLALIRYKH